MTELELCNIDKKLSKMLVAVDKELVIIKDLYSSTSDDIGLGRAMLHIEEKLYDTLSQINDAKRDIKLKLLEIYKEQREEND